MKKYSLLALFFLAACGDPNLEAVNFCTDATQGPVAGVTVKNKQGGQDAMLCHFPEGASCKGLHEATHIDVLEENFIQKECLYK